MATRSATTNGPTSSSGILNNTAADVTTLLNNIQSGKIIYASDINTINSLITDWCQHQHTYSDEYGQHTYGGQDPSGYGSGAYTNGTSGYGYISGTTTPISIYGVSAISAGSPIIASDTGVLADGLDQVMGHFHYLTDYTS